MRLKLWTCSHKIMKIKKYFSTLLCIVSLAVQAQRGVRIAYIDMDVILSKNEEFKTANQLLDEKIAHWKEEIEVKKLQITQRIDDGLQHENPRESILTSIEFVKENSQDIQI